MMFHVKLVAASRCIIGFASILLFFGSCIGSRPATQITDYLLLSNGIENSEGKSLTGFVFENNAKGISIEKYLNDTFATKEYTDREFKILIKNEPFTLILYENAEFEKYFATSNLVVVNLEPTPNNSGRKFIALSIVDANGNDALSSNSLYNSIATDYLKTLKDDYYKNEQ